MALPTRPLTAVVCDSDGVARAALSNETQKAGFEVLETADNGPRVLQLLEFLHPSLVVITNELFGMSGLEVVELISRMEDHPEAILISTDENVRNEAREFSVIGVPPRGDLDALERCVNDAKHLFETGERRSKHDRRSGVDRRQNQDWSKVTTERRSGEERRKGARRSEEADVERRDDDKGDRREALDWRQVTLERRSGGDRRNG